MQIRYVRLLLTGSLLASALSAADPLPITGLAHVGFRVSDLQKARAYYAGILGFQEAFDGKNDAGQITLAFFKINDDQYVEISPSLKPDQADRMTHVAFVTSDIHKLRAVLEERGLAPSAIQRGHDGNLNCGLKDPDGHRLEFVEYQPGSWHTKARGKFMDARRASDHMWHAGVSAANTNAALAFYRDQLGFVEFWRGGPTDNELRYINLRMPGPRGDYIELMLHSTPPTRQQLGSMHHFCLEVNDIQVAHRQLVKQGLGGETRSSPKTGRNGHWLFSTFDPDGSRVEFMEPNRASGPGRQ
ncbi:MAG: VOC family protein [Bryobacteraceae bacterium]